MGFTCWQNYIGLDGCGLEASQSGLYINDVAGITREKLDLISDTDKKTFIGIWDKIEKRAYQILKGDVAKFMQAQQAKILTNLQVSKPLQIQKPVTAIEAEARAKGFYVQQLDCQDPYMVFRLGRVYIYSSNVAATPTTLYVYDLETGMLLFTKDVTVNFGLNSFEINQEFQPTHNLQTWFVGYDCTDVDTVRLSMTAADCWNLCKCYFALVQFCEMDVPTGNLPPQVSTDALQFSAGFWADFSMTCSIDRLMCQHWQDIVEPTAWLYLLAREFMHEVKASDRLNKITSVGLPQAKEDWTYYNGQYGEQIKANLLNLQLVEGDCVECYSPATLRTNLP